MKRKYKQTFSGLQRPSSPKDLSLEMKGLKIKYKPSQDDIDEIESWLVAEEQASHEGFYCNWSIILQSFEDKKAALLIVEEKAIGFITWFERDKVATIQIAEIKPEERKKGYGRYLAEHLFGKLLKKGFVVLDLHCQPARSEAVWKKLGFVRFTDTKGFESENSEEGRHLYRILIPSLKPTKALKLNETISLWDTEPYLAGDQARWKWHPKFQNGSRELKLPIIFPAKRDWQISWNKDGQVIKSEKIKYFRREGIDFSNYIIIEKLPLT
ncbi:GNAT family N-acetyltransferase [Pedobacter psychroterrae]|uniref:GNAT family N-acetyltransferase n=1 Tax=Pedobacter psychroterrae TaxID=2530453 RepID=A0A4R0NTH4_9SPHI|nr:GNAT family N-acetyltransferase [Pedobacter psychroterrae]TCD03223.1 GNAT family N-acetyltransferase [Pedobacter psychroterrae]